MKKIISQTTIQSLHNESVFFNYKLYKVTIEFIFRNLAHYVVNYAKLVYYG
jgi:hypothetical protein